MLDDTFMRTCQTEFETFAMLTNKHVYVVPTPFNKDCSKTATTRDSKHHTQHIIMADFQLTIFR